MVTKVYDRNIYLKHVTVHFPINFGVVKVLDDIDFILPAGKITAIIGESGAENRYWLKLY